MYKRQPINFGLTDVSLVIKPSFSIQILGVVNDKLQVYSQPVVTESAQRSLEFSKESSEITTSPLFHILKKNQINSFLYLIHLNFKY